jgi:hypothetical protein
LLSALDGLALRIGLSCDVRVAVHGHLLQGAAHGGQGAKKTKVCFSEPEISKKSTHPRGHFSSSFSAPLARRKTLYPSSFQSKPVHNDLVWKITRFFEHFKRSKSFILGKNCIHTPRGQGPRVQPNLFFALKLKHFTQNGQLGVLLRATMGNHLSTCPADLVVYG